MMRLWAAVPLLFALCAGLPGQGHERVRLGVEVLLEQRIALVKGKRLGLITNPSGVDGDLIATADRLHQDPRCRLVQLYGPEHGIRGAVNAGDDVADGVDPVTRIPIESLYGKRKRPSKETLAKIDVLLFDIQDVGSRTYTYVSTMGEAMIAAKEAGIPFLVLDRPNPLGGLLFEGAIRLEKWKSFIGWGPTPVTHGMTLGELAHFFNGELGIGCELTVIPMKGWKRSMLWDDTGLTWVQTSPHIPHALQAYLYVATGMIGGITENVNEGVGSTLPFETIAAEFMDARAFAAEMIERKLKGLRFRPISYSPRYTKFEGKALHGVQLLLDDPAKLRPLNAALHFLVAMEKLYPGKVEFKDERNFGIHWGNGTILEMIRGGKTVEEIEATWKDELEAFAKKRVRYLMYR